MFVGWIRRENFENDLEILSQEVVLDKNLIVKSIENDSSLVYGAYDGQKLVALIGAYEFANWTSINSLYYTSGCDGQTKERLLGLLLQNIPKQTPLVVLSSKEEIGIFEGFGFTKYFPFNKAHYRGKAVPFNYTNMTAKSITSENYLSLMSTVDKRCFGDDALRQEYIKNKIIKSSSLIFANEGGYQHSYALGKNIIKISPWIVDEMAMDDAEKMLRGVLYHRGLKNIISFFPDGFEHKEKLYHSYRFEIEKGYWLLCKNQQPQIKEEMIYAL